MPSDLIQQIILLATPFVVKFATDLVKKFAPSVTGVATLFVVALLSAAVSYVSGLVISGSPHWYFQALIGLLAVFIDQVKAQWDASHS